MRSLATYLSRSFFFFFPQRLNQTRFIYTTRYRPTYDRYSVRNRRSENSNTVCVCVCVCIPLSFEHGRGKFRQIPDISSPIVNFEIEETRKKKRKKQKTIRSTRRAYKHKRKFDTRIGFYHPYLQPNPTIGDQFQYNNFFSFPKNNEFKSLLRSTLPQTCFTYNFEQALFPEEENGMSAIQVGS